MTPRASVSLSCAHAAPSPARVSLQLARPSVACERGPSEMFLADFHHLLRSCCGVCVCVCTRGGGTWGEVRVQYVCGAGGDPTRNISTASWIEVELVNGSTCSTLPSPTRTQRLPWGGGSARPAVPAPSTEGTCYTLGSQYPGAPGALCSHLLT